MANSIKIGLKLGEFREGFRLEDYLSKTYKISNYFTCGLKILMDLNFYINRFFNERDFCTIYTKSNGQSSFMVKLSKPRKLNFLIDMKLEKKQIFVANKKTKSFNNNPKLS